MQKAIHDFLTYERTNLVWSSLNTVLCVMPLIGLLVINPKTSDDLDFSSKTDPASATTTTPMSYKGLLILVCIANIFQFAFKPRLFYPDFKKRLFDTEEFT